MALYGENERTEGPGLHRMPPGRFRVVDYSISKPEVRIFGGCAVVTFYRQVSLRGPKIRETIKGRGTHVYVQEEGHWRIVHEDFSKSHRGKGDE